MNIKKKSSKPAWWGKVNSGIKRITNLPPNVRQILDSDRLVYDPTPPAGVAPNAKAFVTTEDVDDDGRLDTVHLVVTNIEKEISPDVLSKINQMSDDDPAFRSIVENIASTLLHEVTHLDDYNPESENPFPGGEPVAESKEKSFSPSFARTTTTNKRIGIDNNTEKASLGELKVKKELISLANDLDRLGHRDLADKLDAIIGKEASSLKVAAPTYAIDSTKEENDAVDHHEDTIGMEEANETAAEAGDEEDDFEAFAVSSQERIKKMASLMASEFTP